MYDKAFLIHFHTFAFQIYKKTGYVVYIYICFVLEILGYFLITYRL